jgi:hypothetical protein
MLFLTVMRLQAAQSSQPIRRSPEVHLSWTRIAPCRTGHGTPGQGRIAEDMTTVLGVGALRHANSYCAAPNLREAEERGARRETIMPGYRPIRTTGGTDDRLDAAIRFSPILTRVSQKF